MPITRLLTLLLTRIFSHPEHDLVHVRVPRVLSGLAVRSQLPIVAPDPLFSVREYTILHELARALRLPLLLLYLSWIRILFVDLERLVLPVPAPEIDTTTLAKTV